jgi:hypothetical protein
MALEPVQPSAAPLGNLPDNSLVRAHRPNEPLPFESSHVRRDRADRPQVGVPRDLSVPPGAAFASRPNTSHLRSRFAARFIGTTIFGEPSRLPRARPPRPLRNSAFSAARQLPNHVFWESLLNSYGSSACLFVLRRRASLVLALRGGCRPCLPRANRCSQNTLRRKPGREMTGKQFPTDRMIWAETDRVGFGRTRPGK